MSETEDDGGIDKEALREELREKYERDEQKRESTRRMSDLLLKGATMTNGHCGTCGDPIFRQNGVNFCPTCHGGPEGVDASVPAEGQGDDPDADGRQPPAAGTAPSDAPPAADDGESADAGTPRADGTVAPTDSDAAPATDDTGSPRDAGASIADAGETGGRNGAADDRSFEPSNSPTNPDAGRSPRTPNATGDGADPRADRHSSFDAEDGPRAPAKGDLGSARESLTVALERFAREAAATDDPRYARECLEAAREAADALGALRR
ncbi:Sjogren's syndrome/scleroderma autoantigen 1 family protein [Halovivax limisalsi]|uniref:Sjogren's syndrome/scleroderma autoantigen 1 family protein n=1 Tax=Halovivax limisalsi TaxID=1453760 RepID=UPI001FFD6F9C|nr:Sjogren's syndrome/scleroderma autoantigen 1 family protein [Halovivax limisalsi]